LTLELEWRLKVLPTLEVFSKRSVKPFKRKFRSSLKNVEIMFEMELIMSCINLDLESLKKFKWTKKRKRISQFKVE